MSMTREEAIKALRLERGIEINGNAVRVSEFLQGLDVAISALRHQIWKDQLWHDAKTDPPKTPGLYYGKKDDTNFMYACQYRDGVWVLDMYPQQKMEIVQWADYTAFARENEETALRPDSREQVEKVWRGEWNYSHKTRIDGFDVVQCSKCGQEALTLALYVKNGNFCPYCGAPMTDEAVEMVMKRMEALYASDTLAL